jgi:hypothetical protein
MEYVVLLASALVVIVCIRIIKKMIKARREIQVNRELRRMYADGHKLPLNGHSIQEWRIMADASLEASRARRNRKAKNG